jgi:hypothetical protein
MHVSQPGRLSRDLFKHLVRGRLCGKLGHASQRCLLVG